MPSTKRVSVSQTHREVVWLDRTYVSKDNIRNTTSRKELYNKIGINTMTSISFESYKYSEVNSCIGGAYDILTRKSKEKERVHKNWSTYPKSGILNNYRKK